MISFRSEADVYICNDYDRGCQPPLKIWQFSSNVVNYNDEYLHIDIRQPKLKFYFNNFGKVIKIHQILFCNSIKMVKLKFTSLFEILMKFKTSIIDFIFKFGTKIL